MRLEGQSKMGYYPTPEVTLSLIPTWLTPQDAEVLRYLDPCCGKGEAIAHVANGHAETFGIELSDARAKEAEDRIALRLPSPKIIIADVLNKKWWLIPKLRQTD